MNDGTAYQSTKYGTKLEYEPERGVISVTKAGSGHYVFLSERDLRELAFEILGTQFELHYDGDYTRVSMVRKVKSLPIPTGKRAVVRTTDGIAVNADPVNGPALGWLIARGNDTYDWAREPGVILEVLYAGEEPE